MDNIHKTERRWSGAGEVVVWVIFYFWAVWIFNAFLPPKPDQTPFESYLGNQVLDQNDGRAAAQSRTQEARELSAQMAADGVRH